MHGYTHGFIMHSLNAYRFLDTYKHIKLILIQNSDYIVSIGQTQLLVCQIIIYLSSFLQENLGFFFFSWQQGISPQRPNHKSIMTIFIFSSVWRREDNVTQFQSMRYKENMVGSGIVQGEKNLS